MAVNMTGMISWNRFKYEQVQIVPYGTS